MPLFYNIQLRQNSAPGEVAGAEKNYSKNFVNEAVNRARNGTYLPEQQ
jgi:hypothetical protein